ncbi:MAG: hypothetical protein ACR2H6_10300 [Pyrinomonadaceae bacterium]
MKKISLPEKLFLFALLIAAATSVSAQQLELPVGEGTPFDPVPCNPYHSISAGSRYTFRDSLFVEFSFFSIT